MVVKVSPGHLDSLSACETGEFRMRAPTHLLHPHTDARIPSTLQLPLRIFLRLVDDYPPTDHPACQVRAQSRAVIPIDHIPPNLVIVDSRCFQIVLSSVGKRGDKLELGFAGFGV